MNFSSAAVAQSYAFCHRLNRRARSSFRGSFLFLSAPKRRAMEALYAFMRHTDDLGDSRLPVELRRQALTAWRAALNQALAASDTRDTPLSPDQRAKLRSVPVGARKEDGGEGVFRAKQDVILGHPVSTGQALLPALADAVCRYHIPPQYLHEVIDGQEMDLEGRRYETFADLAVYCQRVASAVGLACIHVWGFRGAAALEPARACGIAFQLTNILRDLQEDARIGRVYLPAADLRAADYNADDLLQGRTGRAFERLMDIEIERARQHYRQAAQLERWLEPDGRRIFRTMHALYGQLLENIAADPAAVFRRRVRLAPWQKLRIVGQSLFFCGHG